MIRILFRVNHCPGHERFGITIFPGVVFKKPSLGIRSNSDINFGVDVVF